VLAGVALISVVVGPGLYFYQFGSLGLSPKSDDWGAFGSYCAGIFALAFGAASLAALLYASVMVPERIERERRIEQQKRTLAELSKAFYAADYYLGVIVPVWQIACKWLCWVDNQGEGAAYRRDVAGAQFVFKQIDFKTEADANAVPFQNPISLRGHFTRWPAGGYPEPPNEHMLLTMWVRFWCDLETAIRHGSIIEADALASFSRFYSWYWGFMRELWMVGKALHAVQPTGLERENWFLLSALEERFFGTHSLKPEMVDRAVEIAVSLDSQLEPEIARSRLIGANARVATDRSHSTIAVPSALPE